MPYATSCRPLVFVNSRIYLWPKFPVESYLRRVVPLLFILQSPDQSRHIFHPSRCGPCTSLLPHPDGLLAHILLQLPYVFYSKPRRSKSSSGLGISSIRLCLSRSPEAT